MTAITKFYRRGVTKLWFLPAVASVTAGPTSIEVTAGADITPGLSGLTGFSSNPSKIPTPDADIDFTGNIPGEITPADSALTYYEDKLATAIRTALADGTAGFVCIFPQGKVTGRRVETWPVRLGEWNSGLDMTGNVAATQVIDVAVTGKPGKNGVAA
jgi:hypothetical protein